MTVTNSELPGASLARTAVCGPIPSMASRGDAVGDAAALAPQADAIAPKKRASQSRADTTGASPSRPQKADAASRLTLFTVLRAELASTWRDTMPANGRKNFRMGSGNG